MPLRFPLLVALFAPALAAAGGRVDGDESDAPAEFAEISGAEFPGPWVSDLFYEALVNFTVRDVGSTACRKQTEMYERHLRNHTGWAVRMAESWNRQPIGILAGNNYHMGIYDECVDVRNPIRGQYCLSEIVLMAPAGKDYSFNRTEYHNYHGNNHAWHTILGWVNHPDQVQRNILKIGICIPDSCSASDLQLSLQKQFDGVFDSNQLKPIVKVDPIMCTTSGDMYPRNPAYYVTSTILSLLVLICCSATFYHLIVITYRDIQKDNREFSDSVFNAFSFIRSGKELLKFDKENELNSLNGYKMAIMVAILFGHRFMFLLGNPISYSITTENMYLYGPSILLTCMNTVDPFFFMSGYLTYITVSPVFKKAGSVSIKIASPIVYRIVRMLPAYCAMMAITAHIVPHLGDGPLWPQKTWEEAEKCKKYWWTNLLFISNIIDVKYQCLLVSWYVSCDVQFFVIGVIIVYVYTKNVKYGTGLLIVSLVTSLSVPFFVTILTKGDGILKVHLPFLENPRSSSTFNELYRPSYMRATPYFSGLAIGFIVKKLKENEFHFSQKTVIGGTFVATAISVWVQTYAMIFYKRDRSYYPLEQALYSTLSHCTWPLTCAWVFVCLFTSGYGPMTKVFNNRYVVPLGRLSYSVYLVNLVVMMMSQSVQRLPNYLSVKTLLDAWIYDTFKCYFMGLILYLIIEGPFGNLTRKMFGRRRKEKPFDNNGTQIEETICAENPIKVTS